MVEPREFGATWSEMTDRLTRVLAARGVPAQDREDLLQDTALRLYRAWETLDPEQPVWPYAVTIALNLWRDSLRASGPYLRSVDGPAATEPVANLDVERTVIARQELADVSAALRRLAPEQRRLVLETDEIAAVVRPLRAAERMSRMRVRRELARVVGRASAVAALLWLRRPHRAQAFAAAAFTSALAMTVFSGAPAVSVTAIAPMAPAMTMHVLSVRPAAVVVPVAARPAVVAVHRAAPMRHAVRHHAAPAARICAPAPAAPAAPAPSGASDVSSTASSAVAAASSAVVDPAVQVVTDAQPFVQVPTAHATDDGCVEVTG